MDLSALNTFLDSVATLLGIGGGAWALWGAVQFGIALPDGEGAAMRKGLLSALGGAIIVAAAVGLAALV